MAQTHTSMTRFAGRQVAFKPAITVVLAGPGRVRILETHERADARSSEPWRTDTVRPRTMRMVALLGLVPLLIISMAVGGGGLGLIGTPGRARGAAPMTVSRGASWAPDSAVRGGVMSTDGSTRRE